MRCRFIYISLFILLFIVSGRVYGQEPTVTTTEVTGITATTAESGGEVTNQGGDPATARGGCWNTTGTPTFDDNDGFTDNGIGDGTFTSSITGLSPGTTYYVRAYATNDGGSTYVYGNQESFVTLPLVTTAAVTVIDGTTAVSGGNVASDGGDPVTARGVCWNSTGEPTIGDNEGITADGTGTGSFSSYISGLTPGDTYYVRAYATGSTGTGYGSDVAFTTDTVPTVTTAAVGDIGLYTASSGGDVTDDGGFAVTVKGVCWSTSPDPTTANNRTLDGSGTGSFTSALTGLTPGTTYHVRAYATNSAGTGYGGDEEFTTNGVGLPMVTTTGAFNITLTTAESGGVVTDDGGSEVTVRGVCWSTSTNPTIGDDFEEDETGGIGAFTVEITGLTPGTTYHVRAYATNGSGTSYGVDRSFTAGSTTPTVTTAAVSDIGLYTASSGGNVTDDGGSEIIARGVCWSTSEDPTTTSNNGLTNNGSGDGIFTSAITGLSPGTLYYVRAYATNSNGTSYGEEDVSFPTDSTTPTVTTTGISNVTLTTAESGGNVTDNGGSEVTSRGVCWSTSTNPTIGDYFEEDETGGMGSFTIEITGLTPGIEYHVRAYATNGSGTSYGIDRSFIAGSTTPTVTTAAVDDIGLYTASSGGNVTDDGGSPVIARGICWSSTSEAPTTTNNDGITNNGTGPGSFSSSITGLAPGTEYHVRAYAINGNGTSYGEEDVSFTTDSTTPTITTTGISNVTLTTAESGGEVTDDGGAEVNARGVCWSTSSIPDTADPLTLDHTSDGDGTGTFTSSITGLTPGIEYHVRAYAINGNGTAYGIDRSFIAGSTTPEVTTTAVSDIGLYTASSGGEVTDDGGSEVIARGVCWSTSPYPTTENNHGLTNDGGGTGSFTSTITGLTPGTFYYVRAYATNSNGTSYGEEDVSFPTPGTIPTVTTSGISNPTLTTAVCGGNVTDDGGSAVTGRGVCWSTSPYPTTTNNHGLTNDGTGVGSFTSTITGLTPGNTYHVRAYATNRNGTAYGIDISFNAGSTTPTVTTAAEVSNITLTTAESGGNVTDEGGSRVFARGVCWSTSPNPTTANNITNDGSGTGSFTSTITGLTRGTTYHVRAYAINSKGTSYGGNVSFTAGSTTPKVTTAAEVSNITLKTAESGGVVTDDGGSQVTARGVCWSTSPYPTTADDLTKDGDGTGTFTSTITGLTPGTTYHVRAYATNRNGTSYGSDRSFTAGSTTPTVTTADEVSNITLKTAESGGVVTDDGGSPVTVRGVCWSTSPYPTTTNNHGFTTDGSGLGSFTSFITGLTPGETYNVRAYATNSVGTSYGDERTFPTPGNPTISGRITTSEEAGLEGVTLNFSNNGGTTKTLNDGSYEHSVDSGWSGTVTPEKSGYEFIPPDRSYNNVVSNRTNQDYTAKPAPFKISGRVTKLENNVLTGVPGVTMTFITNGSGETATEKTKVEGDYSHPVDSGWSGTVTPSKTGYTISPTGHNGAYENVREDRTHQDYTATTSGVQVVAISGRVETSNGTGVPGVILAFSNGEGNKGYALTDSNGEYSHDVEEGWTGEVTLSRDGYTFDPPGNPYTDVNSNQPNQDYEAIPGFLDISGRIADSSGTGIAGVTLTFSGSAMPGVTPAFSTDRGGMGRVANTEITTTDCNGNYLGRVSPGWSGVVTPGKTGYTFSPGSRPYENITSHQANRDYTVETTWPVISGIVADSDGGMGIPGVTLTFSNSGGTACTDANGTYNHAVDSGWSGTVTPAKPGYEFDPSSSDEYVNVNDDRPGQDYSAFANSPVISGRITLPGGTALLGVKLEFSGSGEPGYTYTDDHGDYTHTVTHGWSGTVTPSKDGYKFEPPFYDYAPVGDNKAGRDYTADPDSLYISGRVTDGSDTGVENVNLALYSGGSTTTDKKGGYVLDEVTAGWSGKVTPQKSLHEFSPKDVDYTNVTKSKYRQDYTAGMDDPKIKGRVTKLIDGASEGFEGVRLIFSNIGGQVTTVAEGKYERVVPYGWSGTVTPEPPGGAEYLFTPSSLRYSNVVSLKSSQNFIAIATRAWFILKVSPERDGTLIIRKHYARIEVTLDKYEGFPPYRYEIYRTSGNDEVLLPWFPDLNVGETKTYNDKDVEKGKTYTYTVKAFDRNRYLIGESAPKEVYIE